MLRRYIGELSDISGIDNSELLGSLSVESFDSLAIASTLHRLDSLKYWYRRSSLESVAVKDTLIIRLEAKYGKEYLLDLMDRNNNVLLSDILLNRNSTEKLKKTNKLILQKADPVFMKPTSKIGRAHFFAPYKLIGSMKIATHVFNLLVIWLMSSLLFISLYYNSLKVLMRRLESMSIAGNINKRVS